MKTNPVVKCLLSGSLVLVFTAVMACSSGNSNHSDQHAGHETSSAQVPAPTFKDAKATAVFEHYLHLKNALVGSDAKEAQKGAAALQTALTKAGSTKGAELAGKIASSSALNVQRGQFDQLSAEVEKVVRTAKLAGGKIYKQHCPMANDGKGGYWLASESTVKNPYYGDEMLNCGSVEEEIK